MQSIATEEQRWRARLLVVKALLTLAGGTVLVLAVYRWCEHVAAVLFKVLP